MSPSPIVAVIIGSLRKESISRKVALALIERTPPNLQSRLVEIGDLPLYNQDLDDRPPESWIRLRQDIAGCQAVLFVTPEYNRSIPGCLKNALDVGSRPQGKSVWAGLPAGVVSVTPYKLGAFGANHALRQTFVFLDMPVMQQPEAYIGGAGDLFGPDGALKDEGTGKFLGAFMDRFSTWIGTVRHDAGGHGFEGFMGDRDTAARAYVGGDAGPLDAMVTAREPATFFHPKGELISGAKAVRDRYDADAQAFAPGGESRLEILNSGSSGGLAFWTGLQHAKATIGGQTASMTLRITEVFRFEQGWKLVHRHADMAKAGEGG
ncbi:MAG TPA: NAD(P)H-dependent oxidoreductase [Caulobacteraceae bacterium]|jgi:NAD(P)H-dependent FMN reductase/ketosteroid isomerase-like protein